MLQGTFLISVSSDKSSTSSKNFLILQGLNSKRWTNTLQMMNEPIRRLVFLSFGLRYLLELNLIIFRSKGRRKSSGIGWCPLPRQAMNSLMVLFDCEKSAVIVILMKRLMIVILTQSQLLISQSPSMVALSEIGVNMIPIDLVDLTKSRNNSVLPEMIHPRALFKTCFSFASYFEFYNSSLEIESSSDDVNINYLSSYVYSDGRCYYYDGPSYFYFLRLCSQYGTVSFYGFL